MVEKKPTDILEEEHRVIEKVLGAIAILIEKLKAGQSVEKEVLQNIPEFMSVFADKCHHGKEEFRLFPLLEKQGVPIQGCPLAILIAEHKKARALVAKLSETAKAFIGADSFLKDELIQSLQGIFDLYPNHIWKEDYLLFPMADKILNSKQQEELTEEFEVVERQLGVDIHSHFEKLAEEIDQKVRQIK
jgi:hemerythrin-like domain-containing protein